MLYLRRMHFKQAFLRTMGLVCALLTNCVSGAQTTGTTSASSTASTAGSNTKTGAITGDRYASEPAVIERNDRETAFAADGTGFERQTFVIRVQTEAAVKDLSVISFIFASASQHIDLDYVRVRHPDGSVVESSIADALEMPTEVMRQAPFYSDLKVKQVPVRGLRPGDKLEWSVRNVRTKAEAPGQFWGGESFTGKERVALSESFTLRLPKSVTAKVWSPKQAPKITEERDERVYRWTSSQLESTVGPEADARNEADKKRTLTAEEVAERVDGTLPLIAWSSFHDWSAVGAWYHGLAESRVTPDAAIKAKAAELTAGKTTDEAKIKAIYAYVSAEIRYIGVALGQGRYQPHLASEVLENQYGDCKDKATLLSSLLAAAGYKSDTVLIGAGIRFNEEVPSPAAFNHAITVVAPTAAGAGAEPIWLDSTQEVAPYRVLLLIERDKQVLRVPLDVPAMVDRTPKVLPFDTFQNFDAQGTIDTKGMAKSRVVYTIRGDDEIALRAVVRQVSPGQYDQAAQYLFSSMGFGGKVTHATFTLPDHTDEPFVMSFDYEREKPGNDWDSYRIFALDGLDGLPILDEKEPPQVPIDLGIPRKVTSTSSLRLPAGWGATLPDAVRKQSKWVKFDRSYRFEKGALIEDKTITVLQPKIPVSEWHEYKKFTDDAGVGSYPYIQLTRKSDAADSSDKTPGPPPPTKSVPEAATLIDEAVKANEKRQLDHSGELLDKAKALNDEQPYLWSVTGYRAFLRGEVTEAVNDYQKEIKLHPNEGNIYQLLAGAQVAQGKRSDAEETLQDKLSYVGPDSAVAIQLSQMLIDDGQATSAINVAETAMTADASNPRLVWILGRARMKAGQKAVALSTLSTALRDTDDAGLRNDIAYDLADAGYASKEVEEASRKSVDQITAESETWKLSAPDQDITEMRQRTSLIVASWDTLGWTIFKRPDGQSDERTAEAERYIAASWNNGFHAVVGLHLGEIKESLHHPAEALTIYQLAEAATSKTDLRGVRLPLSDTERELSSRIERLKKTNASAALKDPGETLRNILKLSAGPSGGESLVAPYRLLLSADGVQDAMAVTGTDGDHGKPDAEKDMAKFRKAIPKTWVPSGSSARILRSGVVNCHQDVCEVVITPLYATR